MNKLVLIFILLSAATAWARPEYALQYRITTCTACHVSPFGAGPKNLDGKMFASRFDEPSVWSKQDLVSADVRALSYYPQRGTQSTQGTALMTTTGFVNVPLHTDAKTGRELRFVGGYSFGGINQDSRDIYAQWRSTAKTDNPSYIQVGRFNVPFGLLTDEHRTFTRLLTRTALFDYEFGASFSKNLGDSIHYDIAITNGGRTGGSFDNSSPASPNATTGYIANVRWMPSYIPLLLGVMGDHEDALAPHSKPDAYGGYFALSLDRLTTNHVSGSIVGEAVWARDFSDSTYNPNITRYFVPQADTDYLAQIADQTALAWYVQLNYNFARRWVGMYRYERLNFDQGYLADRFIRQGIGVKYFADSNFYVLARYEIADVGRPEIQGADVYAAEDAFWIMGQLWL